MVSYSVLFCFILLGNLFCLQERIEAMSAGEKSDMLFKIAKTLPVLVFSMLEQTDVDDGEQQPKEKLSKVPDWCVCQNCREMPTVEERQCCKRKPEACIAHQPVSLFQNLHEESI